MYQLQSITYHKIVVLILAILRTSSAKDIVAFEWVNNTWYLCTFELIMAPIYNKEVCEDCSTCWNLLISEYCIFCVFSCNTKVFNCTLCILHECSAFLHLSYVCDCFNVLQAGFIFEVSVICHLVHIKLVSSRKHLLVTSDTSLLNMEKKRTFELKCTHQGILVGYVQISLIKD